MSKSYTNGDVEMDEVSILRKDIQERMMRSQDWDRLMRALRIHLQDSGWYDQVTSKAQEVAAVSEKPRFSEVYASIRDYAIDSCPPDVQTELLRQIRAFIAANVVSDFHRVSLSHIVWLGMSTPANPKAHHYAKQLEGALCRGAWLESTPAKDTKGNMMSWEETFRKFKKHCTGQDAFATIAVQTQTLATLLLRPDKPRSDSSNGPPPTLKLTPEELDGDSDPAAAPFSLNLEDELLIPEDKREEARMALVALSGEDEKVKDTWSTTVLRAFFAYTLGKPQRALRILATVHLEGQIPPSPSVLTAPSTDAGSRFIPSTTLSTASTTTSTLTPGTGSALQTILSRTGSIASSVGAPGGSGVKQTFSWGAIEHIRTRCVEGMAHERLMDGTAAALAYEAALSLIAGFVPRPGEKGVFEERRELWRWVEMLLYRASVVSATYQSSEDTMRLMKVYCVVAAHWPPSFRPHHRATLYTLYIRTLCLTGTRGTPTWRDDARRSVLEMRAVLGSTTVFPHAGEVNHKVLDFADGCVALWEAGGEREDDAVWVVDTLWWATRLTFHSHRVLRHLFRLLVATPEPDIEVARRIFQLYVRLVRTARLTSAGDVDLQLKRRPTDEPAEHPAEIAQTIVAGDPVNEVSGIQGINGKRNVESAREVEKIRQGDMDDGHTFVDALVRGARMLCRVVEERGIDDALSEAQEAVKFALEIVNADSDELKGDRVLRARVYKAAGIVEALTAANELDPTTRPTRQSTALRYLTESATLDPTSADTFYHLAFTQAEARATSDAVLSARQAVELAPRDVRGWHLLGLLLTAMEDWAGAKVVTEIGIANAEEVKTETQEDGGAGPPGSAVDEGVVVKDFGVGAGRSSSPQGLPTDDLHPVHHAPSIVPSSGILPYSRTLHVLFTRKDPDASPSRLRAFAAATQIRLTEMAIMEKIEGPDGAAGMWPGVFAWYAANAPSSEAGIVGLGPEGGAGGTGSIRTASMDHGDDPNVPRMEFSPASPTNDYDEKDSGKDKDKEKSGKHLDLHKKLLSKSHGHVRELSRRINPKARRRTSTMSRSASVSEPYQASSIHSRHLHRRSSPATSTYFEGESDFDPLSMSASTTSTRTAGTSTTASTVRTTQTTRTTNTTASDNTVITPTPTASSTDAVERRLLSDIWLASAATFRRSSRPAEAHDAIAEAEWLDEANPNVWVQFGLYLNQGERAIEALNKALAIEPEHVPAIVCLAQIFLNQNANMNTNPGDGEASAKGTDMAVGMLNQVTQGAGWDSAEAWYLLGRACGLQGRRERQRACLAHALRLEESKAIRSVRAVLPRCL
ncbi:hypothetical protein FRC12_001842 [Ceratobasidium sp. 428]|nr:hypothetical protein FRC12_001842 [Ceratobasidium sp. 428]